MARWLFLTGLALSSCIGIPTQRESVTHILATAWSSEGRVVALAQKVRVGKNAWLASPEGAGIQEFIDYGDLVFLDERESETHRVPFEERGGMVLAAFAVGDGEGFVVIVSAPDKTKCYYVSNDGTLSACMAPAGYVFESSHIFVPAGSSDLYSQTVRISGSNQIETLNVRTGVAQSLQDEFLALPYQTVLRLQAGAERGWECLQQSARLSPRLDRLAVRCAEAIDKGSTSSLWILPRGGKPTPAFDFGFTSDQESATRSVRAYRNRELRDDVKHLEDRRGGEWSPDQTSLYWCEPSKNQGIVVYFDGRSPIVNAPCLNLVSWSPDGSRLAGVSGWHLIVWNASQGASPL